MINYFVKESKTTRHLASNQSGLTLVEVLFYSVVLVILLTTVTGTFLTMRNAYQQMRLSSALQNSAIVAMDRMEREIRNATSVTLASSTFNTNPGRLTLAGKDASGANLTVEFYVESGAIKLRWNGVAVGALTDPSVSVSNLIFRRLTNPNSDAIKIEATFSDTSATMNRADKYYSTVIVGASI